MMTSNSHKNDHPRAGWCPVYDTPCPQGEESASLCAQRFDENYDPMNNLRDAAMTLCAIQRQEEGFGVQAPVNTRDDVHKNINQSFENGESE